MIETTIQLGEPVEHRGVVIAPLFPRRQPQAEYLTLDQALPLGLTITEVDEAGSVPELLVANPLGESVLLYDGEELLGAKQNRILNVTVLVAGRARTKIPVSCVEQGRWHARSATFAAAGHAAYPELRREKAEQLAAEPLALGRAQSVVWEAVADKAARLDVRSPTAAASDIYVDRERALDALRKAFPLAPGQAGALLALGRERLCLDYLSRPDAFARLYPKLLDGYLLDALEHLDRAAADQKAMAGFVGRAAAAPTVRRPSAGLGEDLRLHADGVVGSGLALGDELVQLSAFSRTEAAPPSRTRIHRPSRRSA